MTAHAIFTIHLKDPEKIAAYREKAADALSKHGGAVLQASPDVTLLDGEGPAPTMAAVLSFPDHAAALAWHRDPDLAATHALRRDAGETRLLLL